MKVLHVIPGIAARYGGPSSAVRAMCSALTAMPSVQVELLTTDADGRAGRLSTDQIPIEFPVHVCRRNWSERWKYSRRLAAWCCQHVAEFDIVHIHAMWSHSTLAAANSASRYGVPYVLRPAGMLSSYSLRHRAVWKRPYWALFEQRTAMRAAMFHATSNAEADDIRAVLPSARITVIANGVEDQAWSLPTDKSWLRRHLGLESDPRPVILFLSRLHPKKGVVDLLLPAVAAMPQRPIVVIAGGADEHAADYERQIRQTIDRLRLQDSVRMAGAVAPQDRWRWLDGADVFVLPSHSENFGIVVAEAMARSCPVLITDTVQSCDHVAKAGAGMVVAPDVTAIRTALENIVQSPPRWPALGIAGRTYAEQRFRWQSIAAQIVDMYGRVWDTA